MHTIYMAILNLMIIINKKEDNFVTKCKINHSTNVD